MRARKTAWIAAGVGLALAMAAGLFLFIRYLSVPAPLLNVMPPNADVYVMIDVESLRSNLFLQELLAGHAPFKVSPEYQSFVEATGLRYQEDLRQVVLAKTGPDWTGAARVRLDRPRIIDYMRERGMEITEMEGTTVYSFGTTRHFRLALLDDDMVLFSVGDDGHHIRQALKRLSGELADSAAGEMEQAGHLSHIREGSAAWAVARLHRFLERQGEETTLGSFQLGTGMFLGSRMLYVSAENGPEQINFQIENECESAPAARRIAGSLQALLVLLKAVPTADSGPAQGNPSPWLKDITVEQVRESVFLRWRWDPETLRFLEPSQR